MNIDRLDHFVLTVKDIDATIYFYTEILGMEKEIFAKNRVALKFGNQKINLHEAGDEFEPKAQKPIPGSADLCFITSTGLGDVARHIQSYGINLLAGPVQRTGATGPIISLYFRDPDLNLIEVSNQL